MNAGLLLGPKLLGLGFTAVNNLPHVSTSVIWRNISEVRRQSDAATCCWRCLRPTLKASLVCDPLPYAATKSDVTSAVISCPGHF